MKMKWNEFIDKVASAKKLKIKLGFNAGGIIRLIYAGAFNGLITHDEEYVKMPAYLRCSRMTAEALKAMKSKAALPKSTKTEPIGVRDIKSDASLVLWRHIVNPLFTYNLVNLYSQHLQSHFGFTPNQVGNTKAIPLVKHMSSDTGKPSTDLYSSWAAAFDQEHAMEDYRNGRRNAAAVGVIVKAAARRYGQEGKRCMDVTFFDGFQEYQVTMWPNRNTGDYNLANAADLKACEFGLFVIKPSIYKGKKGGSLIKFYPMAT